MWLRPCGRPECASLLKNASLLIPELVRDLLDAYPGLKVELESQRVEAGEPVPAPAPARNATALQTLIHSASSGRTLIGASTTFSHRFRALPIEERRSFLLWLPDILRDTFLALSEPWSKGKRGVYEQWRGNALVQEDPVKLKCPYPPVRVGRPCPELAAQSNGHLSNLSEHLATHLLHVRGRMHQLKECYDNGTSLPTLEEYLESIAPATLD